MRPISPDDERSTVSAGSFPMSACTGSSILSSVLVPRDEKEPSKMSVSTVRLARSARAKGLMCSLRSSRTVSTLTVSLAERTPAKRKKGSTISALPRTWSLNVWCSLVRSMS